MAGNAIAVDSATQTSDLESDDEPFSLPELPNVSPRVVIDTSTPFRSVEEAVIRFGGRGFWIPGSILTDVDAPAAAATTSTTHQMLQHEHEVSDINKLEERTVAMLKDLQFKEKENHDILEELDLTKRLVEELKLRLSTESPEFISSVPCLHYDKDFKNDSVDLISNPTYTPEEHSDKCASAATGLIMSELKQAKLNLHQNTKELTAIRAFVESLSKKMEEKSSIEKVQDPQLQNSKYLGISRELRELNHEAYQFMKTAEAAKSEVVTAMSEIEQTKAGLTVVEMRWLMAKKLEEAARAVKSVALAETRDLSTIQTESMAHKPARICLSLEEYHALTEKTRKADRVYKRNSIPIATRRDSRLLDSDEFEFVRNGFKSSTRPKHSLGDILSRKFEEESGGAGRERVSLNQMLSQQREETSPQRRRESGRSKGLFSKRKGLGLVHISLPLSKHGKNKIRAFNHW